MATSTNPVNREVPEFSPEHAGCVAGCSRDDIIRLRDLILAHAVKGDMGKRVIDYLFRQNSRDRICAQDITDNGGPKGDSNVCPFMSRLREQLSEFFDYHPIGRREPCRVLIPAEDRGNYALRFEANWPPTDLVQNLWRPHFAGPRVGIVYPEVQMPADAGSVRIPNGATANATVRSILRLSESFRGWKIGVGATPVVPSVQTLELDNSIVLASPMSMPALLSNLEEAVRMRTGIGSVTVIDEKDGKKNETHRDTPEAGVAAGGSERVKWCVLTRHRFAFERTLTMLAASDELAIDSTVQFLLNEESARMLARALRCGDPFPNHFQALFRVRMFHGYSFAHDVTLHEAFVLS